MFSETKYIYFCKNHPSQETHLAYWNNPSTIQNQLYKKHIYAVYIDPLYNP